ncbi:hypothetical protein BOX15_Mlig034010g2 [Macrostomum lignano]|uniref:Uncharacterized protein n=1 Tax=Macrostomum lignano TaxID=282301 RepID=A0A267EYQ3_9PLAT|nr:hypothetical protein BOX15_Mlig034010g2 [Macrostomum lignano]
MTESFQEVFVLFVVILAGFGINISALTHSAVSGDGFVVINDEQDFLVKIGRASVDCDYGVRDPYEVWARAVDIVMCPKTSRCAELEGPSVFGDGRYVSYKAGCEDICPKQLPPGYKCRLCHASFCNLKLQGEIVNNTLRCLSNLVQPYRMESAVAYFCSRGVQYCYLRLAATKDRILGGCYQSSEKKRLCDGPDGTGACEFCSTNECNKPSGRILRELQAHQAAGRGHGPSAGSNAGPANHAAGSTGFQPIPQEPTKPPDPIDFTLYMDPDLSFAPEEVTQAAVATGGSPRSVLVVAAILLSRCL